MNIIFIMSDSVRWDFLGYNGNDWIKTPYLDALAAQSCVFNEAFLSSYPTVPNRWDILTGKLNYTYAGWQPLESDETVVPQRLAEQGYVSMMIADTPHILAKGYGYQRGFDGWEWVRGQENDAWKTAPREVSYPCDPDKLRSGKDGIVHYLRNVSDRRGEEDYFAPRTIRRACDWLDANHDQGPFFLYLDMFDPHEPWDPPQWYVDMYDPGYQGRVIENPPYGFYKRLGITDREMKHTAARYAGECTMVDNCVGRLLVTLEKLGLIDEVAIVFTSDHGIYAGLEGDAGTVCKPHFVGPEGAWLIKGVVPKGNLTFFPLRTGTMRIPLFIKMPGQSKLKRFRQIVQPWDLTPTVMEMFGLKAPKEFQGESILPVIKGRKMKPRPYAFNGAYQWDTLLRQAINKDYIYACWPTGEREPWLIDLKNNPGQDKNLAEKNPQVCRKMHDALAAFDPVAFEGVRNPW